RSRAKAEIRRVGRSQRHGMARTLRYIEGERYAPFCIELVGRARFDARERANRKNGLPRLLDAARPVEVAGLLRDRATYDILVHIVGTASGDRDLADISARPWLDLEGHVDGMGLIVRKRIGLLDLGERKAVFLQRRQKPSGTRENVGR